MRIKLILPALTEAKSRHWRSIKYSLFPPLGLATLAGYLNASDEAEIVDEHVDQDNFDDTPDLVAIQVYITSARRSYQIADSYRKRGVYVVMGGLHVTACPEEARLHADTIVTGPAEEAWPRFLADFRNGTPQSVYQSAIRELLSLPMPRRDLIKRRNYLVPNSIVVSRGCPHRCDFCYSNSFFRGGSHFYTCTVDRALEEIDALPGRHLFFLDDNVFGDPKFATALFEGMRGTNRVWQGAATVQGVLNIRLLDLAVESGLRSLFIGFESLNQSAMSDARKQHNRVTEYSQAIRLLHERGVMINGSFVFGLDGDTDDVFDVTTEWTVFQGIETATFHILTPYPGTDLFRRYFDAGRISHCDWDMYDTRHAVFSHPTMDHNTLEQGYWRAYETFYQWNNIVCSAGTKSSLLEVLRHVAYVGAGRKFDPLWAMLIRLKKLDLAIPSLEQVLKGRFAPDAMVIPQTTLVE